MRWFEKWLNSRSQRLVVSGTRSSLIPVTSSVPKDPILGTVLFNSFISDLDGRDRYLLTEFTDDMKLRGVDHTTDDCGVLQKDLNSLEITEKNNLKFNKGK